MSKLRPFQIVLLAIFALVGIGSLVMLSTYDGIRNITVNPYGSYVEIWGTFDEEVVRDVIQDVTKADKHFKVVEYIEKDARTFEEELVNAIAEGRSPDVILMQHDDLVTYRSKLLAVPYDTFPQRTFKDLFIDGAEIFTRLDGIYAIPFAVDPLVMYWNRDIFSSGGIAEPPRTWEHLVADVVPVLTLRNATRDILQSTVAFGEYRNVINAKAVLSMLLMQSGSRLVEETDRGYVVALDDPIVQNTRKPLDAALQFFVDFSNANSALYSWNRSQQDDLTAFLAEDLALYFGFGSEALRIRDLNPNFNFDVVPVPQGAGATIRRTYGTFYGYAFLEASDNSQGAYAAVQQLVAPDVAGVLAARLSLAPVHRSVIAQGAENPYRQTVLDMALVARGWLDPDKEESDVIFQEMVEDVVSNRKKVSGAVSDAVKRLELIF